MAGTAESRKPTTHSLVGRLENAITHFFYGKTAAERRRLPYEVGLQVPLWMWTHHAPDHREHKEAQKICNLVSWMLYNHVDPSRVAILTSLGSKGRLRKEIQRLLESQGSEVTLPTVMAHHELTAINTRDHTLHKWDVVVYVLDLPADPVAIPQAVRQEEFMGDAIAAAERAFVLVADAAWTAPALTTKWPQWKHFLAQLNNEQPFISKAGASLREEERFSSLIGCSIPLCCSQHPNHRQLEYGLTTIVPTCKHLCLRPYACGKADHLCRTSCHPHTQHTVCPFACKMLMPCGHECLLSCSVRCNCFQIVERPLSCSHQIVLGLNKETLEAIYGTVHHVFKGVCADAELPCAVQYATECARCLGPLQVKCFEAQQQQHTLENKTLVCGTCRRLERELRMKILGEILCGTEVEKQKLKVELQRTLHQQRKAASQGLFHPGVKVEITDSFKCVPPLFAEDDFPGVKFVDLEDPSIFGRLQGAYGTFISNHVDLADRSEVRNLVRLPNGDHVLVIDGGLRMIRALTSSVTEKATLLLTFNGASADATENTEELAAAQALLGNTYHLSRPVSCPEVEGGTITDRVVSVVAVDPASPQHVVVECRLWLPGRRLCRPTTEDDSDPHAKKVRTEDSPVSEKVVDGESVLRFLAPIEALESMNGYRKGQHLYVSFPERQICNPHDMEMLTLAARYSESLGLPAAALTATPVDPDSPYELLGVINPPPGLEEPHVGPCALLRPKMMARAPRPVRSALRRGRGSHPAPILQPVAPFPVTTADHQPLIAVPFVFTIPNELTEAENALDSAAQQSFERRLEAALQERSEEMSLRNDEEAFYAQQCLGTVTSAKRQELRQSFSIPIALPTEAAIAAARSRQLRMPFPSDVTTRILKGKEALLCKAELLRDWTAGVSERLRKDAEATAQYMQSLPVRYGR